MRRDIDEAIRDWPFDPTPGEVQVRELRARDGRPVIQIRIELGVLQLETEGRPDGSKPHGFASYLDYLRHRAAGRGQSKTSNYAPWSMQPEHCVEADREFIQFYHRRIAWLSLQRYDKALRDADHTLALMDFVCRHATDPEYVDSHERFRGLVLFHRTQAAAALALERRRPEEAIDAVREGIERLTAHHAKWSEDHSQGEAPNETLIEQLKVLETEIRKNFAVSKTLREQLDEAVAREDYESAARIRDLIRNKPTP